MITKIKRQGPVAESLGGTPRIRIIEFFATGKEIDHSLGNIIRFLDLSKATVYNICGDLLHENIVKKTRKVAGTQLYRLDDATKKGKLLNHIFEQGLKKSYEKDDKTKNG